MPSFPPSPPFQTQHCLQPRKLQVSVFWAGWEWCWFSFGCLLAKCLLISVSCILFAYSRNTSSYKCEGESTIHTHFVLNSLTKITYLDLSGNLSDCNWSLVFFLPERQIFVTVFRTFLQILMFHFFKMLSKLFSVDTIM